MHRHSRCGDDARRRRAVRARSDDAHRHRQLARQGNRPHRRDGHGARERSARASRRASIVSPCIRPERFTPATIDTYDDHRMAMCFSLAALRRCRDPDQRSRVRAQDVPGLLRRLPLADPGNAMTEPRMGAAGPIRGAGAEAVPPVIAIDGPAASGKGTIAAGVAQALRFHLLDSGSLYRLVALKALESGIAVDDAPAPRRRWPRDSTSRSRRGASKLRGPRRDRWPPQRSGQRRRLPRGRPPAVRRALLERQRAFRRAPGTGRRRPRHGHRGLPGRPFEGVRDGEPRGAGAPPA